MRIRINYRGRVPTMKNVLDKPKKLTSCLLIVIIDLNIINLCTITYVSTIEYCILVCTSAQLLHTWANHQEQPITTRNNPEPPGTTQNYPEQPRTTRNHRNLNHSNSGNQRSNLLPPMNQW